MKNKPKKKEKKPRGKPISLYPLEVEDVLEDILQIKPNLRTREEIQKKKEK